MHLLSFLPSLLLSFASLSLAAPPFSHLIRQANSTCTAGASIDNLYTFSNLRINYAPSGGQSTAAFAVTNTRTNLTEVLPCTLRIGYQCQYNGTPENPALQVWLQLNLAAYFSFMDTSFCPGRVITGQAEMAFTCPDTPFENGMICRGDVESVGARGTVEEM
ncbi:hypothetical protein B0T14DRAFT_565490 [Immersiella caudata]|uniref:AA1-like domain-containing protein n=1 Tax=Immersiella caudata TaxID=314043 RepID=A0AA39WYY5_9PEZI|nr:hypothetical protein B0T14DRAFT_565490 [Immersiella caudata]